ncbi:hypothetical protein EDD16DRAFT_523870 [Pisolithus croceorrhizus]|nr:hypothetical protein EDD16DRAFT_523870 [Pisolithus croceorrhizus]
MLSYPFASFNHTHGKRLTFVNSFASISIDHSFRVRLHSFVRSVPSAAAGYGHLFSQPRVHVLCLRSLSSRAPPHVSFALFISTPFMLNLSTLHAWLSRWHTHLISPNVPNPPCGRVTDILSTVVITIVPCGVRRSATDTLRGHSNVGVFVICSRARTRATALRISRGRPFLFGAVCRVHTGGYVLFDPSNSKRRYGYVSPTVLVRDTSTQDTWWVVFESHFLVGCFATPSLLPPALQEGASTITQHTSSAAP